MTTVDLEDARWRAALDAELSCEATESQRRLLVAYKPRGEEYRVEQALMRALEAGPSDGDAPGSLQGGPDDDALFAAVMESLDAETHLVTEPDERPFAWRALLLGAAAAVVTIGVGLGIGLGALGPRASSEASVAVRNSPIASATRGSSERSVTSGPRAGWSIASGSAVVSASETTDAELPIDTVLEAHETLCTSSAGVSLCIEPGAKMRSDASGSLALLEGAATLQTGDSVEAQHLLDLGTVAVEPSPNSVIVVERQTAAWSVRVERGGAAVLSSTSTRRVQPGETLSEGELNSSDAGVDQVSSAALPSTAEALSADASSADASAAEETAKPMPRPKVSTLLAEARELRRNGEMRRAIRTYQRLIENHPRSPSAQTARLSVGQLQLDAGQAKAALRSFRSYLRSPGALREDAAYGEIRALRSLGRDRAAQAAVERFRARYPKSRYGASLNSGP